MFIRRFTSRFGLTLLIAASTFTWAASMSGAPAPAEQNAAPAAAVPPAGAPAPQAATPAPTLSPERRLVNTYCVTCHNTRLKTADLTLDVANVENPVASAGVWEKVVKKLKAGAMPPPAMPRPPKETIDGFVAYLERSLDTAAAATPNPGRSLARRMNRSEYANVIRDLLGLTVDPAVLLPPDDEAFGFDNNADALKISPLLLERYLSAAWAVSHMALGSTELRPDVATYRMRGDASQRTQMAGLPLGTQGGMTVKHYFPRDGEYEIRPRLWRTAFENAQIKGLDEVREIEYSIDGERVFLGQFGGPEDLALDQQSHAVAADAVEGRLVKRLAVKAGEHTVTIAFLKKNDALAPDHAQPFERSTTNTLETTGVAHLDRFTISGPFGAAAAPVAGVASTVSRSRIFICTPARPAEEEGCARRILSTLSRRAFRRPVSNAEVDRLVEAYREGREDSTFDLGVARALRSLLASPEFLFRFETDPANARPNSVARVSDLDMASRLSFFLWSSIPDEELLDLASRGRLQDQATLERQVRRMLADPRSAAFVRNFSGQWLQLRNLRNLAPDPQAFPDFDDNLRQAMQRETELFFESVLREDRSVIDLLTADYTFLNDRLARHYGIPGVVGDSFQRVSLRDYPARWGILGKASTLTVTSYVTRTAPTIRGKWILTQLLGTPPSPPPDDVVIDLEETSADGAKLPLRQRMELHRKNPACASCHRLMDPPGFALENFNAVGEWRTLGEDGRPIDTAGELVDGTKVDSPIALRNAIASRPDAFASTLTEKLLTYALGRGVDYVDMPAVRTIVRESAKQNYRFTSVILNVIRSVPFQMKKATEPLSAGQTAQR